MKTCKGCEHFKIISNPAPPWNPGYARCMKHDLIYEYPRRINYKYLHCPDDENSDHTENQRHTEESRE